MKYGLGSGILWGLDTLILGIAVSMAPLAELSEAPIASAFLHDACCAIMLLLYMGLRGRLGDTVAALKTRSGRVVMVAALLGGPLGMTGYLIAIANIGSGYTAIISAFYPAVGTVLAVLALHECMRVRQVIALMAALGGVMTMGWMSAGAEATAGDPLLGVTGALVCVFGWGSEAVILAWGMRDDAVDNETALQIRETTSALVYGLVVAPVAGALNLAGDVVTTPAMGVIALAALAGTVSYLFYYQAINRIGAARGMALNISYSAWAVIFGVIILGNIPQLLDIVCCVLILGGTVLSATAEWVDLNMFKREDPAVDPASGKSASITEGASGKSASAPRDTASEKNTSAAMDSTSGKDMLAK